jgi:hypothetical protein
MNMKIINLDLKIVLQNFLKFLIKNPLGCTHLKHSAGIGTELYTALLGTGQGKICIVLLCSDMPGWTTTV